MEITNPLIVEYIILGLGAYFSLLSFLANQKRAMRRGISNPRRLTVRHYVARLVYLNDYLVYFPGAKLTEKIGVTELNDFFLLCAQKL